MFSLIALLKAQGWRESMEDAHLTAVPLESPDLGWGDVSLFGVFDGHGGFQEPSESKMSILKHFNQENET